MSFQLNSKGKTNFKVTLPNGLKRIWKRDIHPKKISAILEEKNIKFTSGILSFKTKVIENIFDITVGEIVEYVEKSLKDKVLKAEKKKCIVVVGGFAMSGYVLEKIRNAFSEQGIPVVRPQQTELAVLKGAVLYGQNESIITSRVSQYTYGVAMTMKFDKKMHTKEYRYEENGQIWANFVFRRHVTKGQKIQLGEWIEDKEYYPDSDNQEKAVVYVYASTEKEPIHTTDKGCVCIGQFDIEFPKSGNQRGVKVAMRFGGTEVEVRGVVGTTRKQFQKNLRLP